MVFTLRSEKLRCSTDAPVQLRGVEFIAASAAWHGTWHGTWHCHRPKGTPHRARTGGACCGWDPQTLRSAATGLERNGSSTSPHPAPPTSE